MERRDKLEANRLRELNNFLHEINLLQKKYNVEICSDNGYTDAIFVDQVTGKGYRISENKDSLQEFY